MIHLHVMHKNFFSESISVFETEGTKILDASSEYERASNQSNLKILFRENLWNFLGFRYLMPNGILCSIGL
jgi:hypothetical protein